MRATLTEIWLSKIESVGAKKSWDLAGKFITEDAVKLELQIDVSRTKLFLKVNDSSFFVLW